MTRRKIQMECVKYYFLESWTFPTKEEEIIIDKITEVNGVFVANPSEADVIIIGDSVKAKEIHILSREKKIVEQYTNSRNFIGRRFFT